MANMLFYTHHLLERAKYIFVLFVMIYLLLIEIIPYSASSSSGIRGLTKSEISTKPECKQNASHSDRIPMNCSTDRIGIVEGIFETVSVGGKYKPNMCISKQRIAVVIPYRDREEHLKIFLCHMHPFLQRQQLYYTIFVIEMDGHLSFNRGALKNIGFLESMKLAYFTCVVFHDVDLLPEDDRIPYSCANLPRHLSVAVDSLHYRLPYPTIFGGVVSMRIECFHMINGFSNMYVGWGGEDDDLYNRLELYNFSITRPPIGIARYKMTKHKKDTDINKKKKCMLRNTKRFMHEDGLNSMMYTVKAFEFRQLYTWILVQLKPTEQSHLYQNCTEETKV